VEMNKRVSNQIGIVAVVALAAMTLPAQAYPYTYEGVQDPVNGEILEVPARAVFAPEGFDDNDEAVFMVDGYLPSGCYRLMRPEVEVDHAAKRIAVKPMARYFDVPCI